MSNGNGVALWAGVASFFGTILAVGIFDVFDITGWEKFLSSLIVSALTAATVYSKERYEHERHKDERLERLEKK